MTTTDDGGVDWGDNSDYIDDEDDEYRDYPDDDDDDERSTLGRFVFSCGVPNCVMPGPHYTSECHTPEDLMQYEEDK